MSNTYGRAVDVPMTNKSGAGVVAGDVVVYDSTTNDSFTTTTSAASLLACGIAQDTIASNAVGRIRTYGYCALVNTSGSVTRLNFGATHTVAKQAADIGAARVSGTFLRFLSSGATPDAVVYPVDLAGAALTNPMTTKGDIIVADTGGTPTRLAPGAAGTFLQSAGAAAFPVYAAQTLVLLEQHTASTSATLDFTTFISATYDDYLFEFINLNPATTNVDLDMTMGTGAGPTWDTGTNYGFAGFRWSPSGHATAGASSGLAAIQVDCSGGIKSDTLFGISGQARLFSPQSTAVHKRVVGESGYVDNTGAIVGAVLNGMYLSTTAVTGIRFLMHTGNITSGTIRVYGIAK